MANNRNEKPVWHRDPQMKPSYYGKHRSLLPPSNMKQALLHYNMTEQRLLVHQKNILTNQQMWTKKIHNLQKKAFIIRQLLQQEMLKARGINCNMLLPQIVIEAHTYLAQSELMKMNYLGAKHLPMHGRMRLGELQKYEEQMFEKAVKPTQAQQNRQQLQRQQTGTNLNQTLPTGTNLNRTLQRQPTGTNLNQTLQREPMGINLNHTHRESTTYLNHTTQQIMTDHNVNFKSEIANGGTFASVSLVKSELKSQPSHELFIDIEDLSPMQGLPPKNNNKHNLKCNTSFLDLPDITEENLGHGFGNQRAISMPVTPLYDKSSPMPSVQGRTDMNSLPQITQPKARRVSRGHSLKPNLSIATEPRFTHLEQALTPSPTKPHLSYSMLSPASWEKYQPISAENRNIIRTKYQPTVKSRLNVGKIHDALQCAKHKGNQADEGNLL